jgi:hypothetical protein
MSAVGKIQGLVTYSGQRRNQPSGFSTLQAGRVIAVHVLCFMSAIIFRSKCRGTGTGFSLRVFRLSLVCYSPIIHLNSHLSAFYTV